MNHVYKLHGLPKAIISDRDRIFTTAVWQELFHLSDTKLMMSSAYHPQTDGQIVWSNGYQWKLSCVALFIHVQNSGVMDISG